MEPASPGHRRSGPLGGQGATRSEQPWGHHILIGVFDSGIGGLSVLKALRQTLPQHDFTYVADSGHAPYGERDEAYVLARTRAVSDWLIAQEIEALVIACNTATAAAVHLLRAAHPGLPIIGLEPALKPAVSLTKTGRVGVMATRSTLASAKFRALHASLEQSADFTLQPCDGLAGAIERSAAGEARAEVKALCAQYITRMGPFGNAPGEIDTLVLGCTHYPFVAGDIRQLVGDGVQLVDTGEAVARHTARILAETAVKNAVVPASRPGAVALLTTGDPALLEQAAAKWLEISATAGHLSI
ncbi:MAG: glutamate racemase [Comamonadaceae bacterium]|nr:MAG: glutamate racemase [Comamonadaceae bacterium]